MSPRFEECLRFTLHWEGGFVHHPQDPGGATNMGITQGTYNAWRSSQGLPHQSVREITRDEVRTIYHDRYWLTIGGPSLPPGLDLAAFDAGVNSGVGRARRWLEAHPGPDGVPLTLYRLRFLTNLTTFNTFGRGWTRRIHALLLELVRLQSRTPPPAPVPADQSLIMLFTRDGAEAGRVPLQEGESVLFRARGNRYFIRPDAG